MQQQTKVEVWEMDSWSGRKHLKTKEFDNMQLAQNWVKEFNSKNNLPTVPEYYTYAEIV